MGTRTMILSPSARDRPPLQLLPSFLLGIFAEAQSGLLLAFTLPSREAARATASRRASIIAFALSRNASTTSGKARSGCPD